MIHRISREHEATTPCRRELLGTQLHGGIPTHLVLQIQNLLNLILVAVALSESSEADVLGGLLHPESLLLFHATLEIW